MKEFFMASFIFLAIGVIIFGPLATIWSLNTLFNLNIAYNFSTWTASLFITSIFSANGIKYKKD
jgi:hypothetical protein